MSVLYIRDKDGNLTPVPFISSPGEDGYTPIRGIDYWTEEDQESIIQQVITALGTPVFGRVDENNNIILTGNLADGTYTLKYEDAEGETLEIGTLDIGSGITNMIPLSIGSDKALYNGGKGYKEGYRLNSSASETAQSGMCVTGFIPVNYGDTIRFANITMNPKQGVTGYNYIYVYLYDENFARITPGAYLTGNNNAFPAASENVAFDSDGNVTMVKIDKSVFTSMEATTTIKYVRISAQSITDESIITVNEDIA